jgi:hypothetical protein
MLEVGGGQRLSSVNTIENRVKLWGLRRYVLITYINILRILIILLNIHIEHTNHFFIHHFFIKQLASASSRES